MLGRSCCDDNQSPSLDIRESAPCSALSKILDKSLSPKVTNNPNVLLSPNFLNSIALTQLNERDFEAPLEPKVKIVKPKEVEMTTYPLEILIKLKVLKTTLLPIQDLQEGS